jgi:hypothetical protein
MGKMPNHRATRQAEANKYSNFLSNIKNLPQHRRWGMPIFWQQYKRLKILT